MAQFEKHLTNDLTGEIVLIKSNDYFTFQSKVEKRIEMWNKQKEKLLGHSGAEEKTLQTQKEIESYKTILNATLSVNDKIDWESLKDSSVFKALKPSTPPNKDDYRAIPIAAGLLSFIPYFKRIQEQREVEANSKFEQVIQAHNSNEEHRKADHEKERFSFADAQQKHNESLERLRTQYEQGAKEGVESYINMVLEHSQYPESLNLFSEVTFDPNQKVVIVDVDLPSTENVPSIIEYKYVQSRQDTTVKEMKKKEFEDFYNDVLYQITLRTVHEILESDYKEHIQLVVFNGWVTATDTATGQELRNCILSVQIDRKVFVEVKLDKVNPRDCFLSFKGLSAGSLIKLAPVRPIMKLNREDGRIIEAANVLDELDQHRNLATMEWQDFEVLVRDIIGKEFSHEGCEVQVTQASRDQGVDAIAFDEDPIRGGKYVIQAKRYNNLVPVSAVRDLYGTVMNEGAVKGIAKDTTLT